MSEKKREPQANYYSIIPASVRYDNNLTANAKLLYGEISALCKKEGYCWAKNVYFAELYDVSKRSIISWITSLEKTGHIKIRVNEKQNKRRIYLQEVPDIRWGVKKSSGGYEENFRGGNPPGTTVNRNNGPKKSSITTNNITKNKTEEEEGKKTKKIAVRYKKIFNSKLSVELYQKMLNYYTDEDILLKALEIAEENGADTPKYLLDILADWENRDIKSVESVNTYLKNRQTQKPTQTTNSGTEQYRELEELYQDGYR